MLEVAIMVEGQNGLIWSRWQKMARTVEELGFVGLYRSDHFTNTNPPDKESLELWVSLTWLASNTSHIEFGSLVSPVSFRHPALTARMASAVDDLSRGRLTLGLGAGWQEHEHHAFGFDLLDMQSRFDRFEEGLQAVTSLLKSDQAVTFNGKYFQLNEAILLPRPQRPGGPRILIGGIGVHRTLPLVARYADEWNAMFLTPQQFEEKNRRLDELLAGENRTPESVRRSMMTGLRFGRTQAELDEKLSARKQTVEQARGAGLIVGVGNEIVGQLLELEKVGVQRIMLQWLDLDDLDGLAALAKALG